VSRPHHAYAASREASNRARARARPDVSLGFAARTRATREIPGVGDRLRDRASEFEGGIKGEGKIFPPPASLANANYRERSKRRDRSPRAERGTIATCRATDATTLKLWCCLITCS